MSKRQFALTVGAYLTGWVIAQATFARAWRWLMRHGEMETQDEFARRLGPYVARPLVEVMELDKRIAYWLERDAIRTHRPRLDCACTECRAAAREDRA